MAVWNNDCAPLRDYRPSERSAHLAEFSPPPAEVAATVTTAAALRIAFYGPVCLKVVTSIVAREHLVSHRITAYVGSASVIDEFNLHLLRPARVGKAYNANDANIRIILRRQAVLSRLCSATGLWSHACQFDHLIMELHTRDPCGWPRLALHVTIVGRL